MPCTFIFVLKWKMALFKEDSKLKVEHQECSLLKFFAIVSCLIGKTRTFHRDVSQILSIQQIDQFSLITKLHQSRMNFVFVVAFLLALTIQVSQGGTVSYTKDKKWVLTEGDKCPDVPYEYCKSCSDVPQDENICIVVGDFFVFDDNECKIMKTKCEHRECWSLFVVRSIKLFIYFSWLEASLLLSVPKV